MDQHSVGSDILGKTQDALAMLCPSYPRNDIVASTRLIDDLAIDSLKVAELSLLLEEKLDVAIFFPDLLLTVAEPRELTVGMLVSFLENVVSAEQR